MNLMLHAQTLFSPALRPRSGRRLSRLSRRGIQLLELVISLSTASVLMVGISSAIIISNQAVEVATSQQATSSRNIGGLDRLRSDLAEGYPASLRSATGVTLSVADRTGDNVRDKIQYRWNGATHPLEFKMNTGGWQSLTDPLTQFEMDWRTCDPQSINTVPQSLEPANAFVFQSMTLADTGLFNANSVSIGIPETYQPNDLLVAAIAVEKDQKDTIAMPAGWTKVFEHHKGNDVSLAVFYRFSSTGSSVSINWTDSSRAAYATLAHFRVGSASPALSSFVFAEGDETFAPAPAATATADNSLVIRALAAKSKGAVEDAANMPGHVAIAWRSQLFTEPTLGMTYRIANTGTVPAASFGQGSKEKFVSATVVFQP